MSQNHVFIAGTPVGSGLSGFTFRPEKELPSQSVLTYNSHGPTPIPLHPYLLVLSETAKPEVLPVAYERENQSRKG